MNDSTSPLKVSQVGAVGILELARPDKFNCLSSALFRAIDAALTRFEAEGSGVRALLICAQGAHFCTGADLDEVQGLRPDLQALSGMLAAGHDVLRRLEASPLPVVAACQGLALAGGLELMLACDVVFAARDARFGDQHAQFGLVPGWSGSQRLPRLVGLRRAMDLFLSARWLSADEAQQWGLVNHVCDGDKLAAEAMAYCQKLATRSRGGLALMKKLARQGLQGSLATGLALEEELAPPALQAADVTEGLAAFQARRKPQFSA
jgi:enoyl-CoA hydratase